MIFHGSSGLGATSLNSPSHPDLPHLLLPLLPSLLLLSGVFFPSYVPLQMPANAENSWDIPTRAQWFVIASLGKSEGSGSPPPQESLSRTPSLEGLRSFSVKCFHFSAACSMAPHRVFPPFVRRSPSLLPPSPPLTSPQPLLRPWTLLTQALQPPAQPTLCSSPPACAFCALVFLPASNEQPMLHPIGKRLGSILPTSLLTPSVPIMLASHPVVPALVRQYVSSDPGL